MKQLSPSTERSFNNSHLQTVCGLTLNRSYYEPLLGFLISNKTRLQTFLKLTQRFINEKR